MLSDLATVTGDVLDDTKLSGNPSLQSSRSRWNGVHQEKPSPLEWRLWRKANRLWSQPSGRLDVPLGRWLRKHRDRRIELFAYQYRNRLAVRVADGFVVCRQSQQSYTRYEETSRVIRYLNIPNEAVPTTVVHNDDLSWEVIHRGMVLCSNVAQSDMSTFSSFIESLAPWEIDILRHTTLSVDPRMAVWELQEHFQAGTDGSSKHHGTQGAFGWIVTTSSGERIASGNGPSRGAKIDSYRAECSGMLTFLRFLIRLAEYTDMFGTWVGRVGTDSQSMLDRLFGKQNTGSSEVHRYNASNLKELDVFVSEWDLLHEIQIALRLLPDVTLEYVKGHQDDHVDFSSLSLMAQLNVEADGLATRYQQQFGRTCPHVLMSEHAGAYLVVEDGTVTHKVPQIVRRLATGPPLREYIRNKNGWNENIMHTINWQAHARFMKHNIERRVHFSKMVHECLPTNSLRNRMDSGRRTCPVCPSEHETRDHILRCSSSSRVVWRTAFLHRLEEFHGQEDTCPFIRFLLREALSQWFREEENDITVSPLFFPRDVRDIILQQNAIGWRQIFNARFGSEWSRVQQEYYCKASTGTSGNKQRTGERWQVKLAKLIGENWLELWKVRNPEVHGHDHRTQAEALRRDVSRQLDGIYQQRAHYEPQVQRLLFPDVNEHLNRPMWVTRNWLAINAPIFRESMRRAKDRAIQGVRSLHSYFPSMS